MMSNAAQIVRNTIANWTGIAVGSLVLLLLTPYVRNVLGDERFGIYLLASQAMIYVNLLAMGMREAATRFTCKEIAADNTEGLNAVLSTMTVFFVGVGVLGIGICTALGWFAPRFFEVDERFASETFALFVGLGFVFLFGLIGNLISGVLIGHQRYDLLNLGNIIRDISRAAMLVLVFALGWQTLGGLITAMVSGYVLAFSYFVVISKRQHRGLRVFSFRMTPGVTREIMGIGMWNGINQMGNVVTFATPAIIVGKVLGPEVVGLYSVPFMLAERLRILVWGMANTLLPLAAATLVTGDRGQFRQLIVRGTKAAATLCFPIGAVLLVLSKPFLGLWMGADYAESWIVYGIVMIAMFGRISQAPTLHVLIGGGRIRGLACIQLVSSISTVFMIGFLITQTTWGVLAAAVGIAVPLFLSHSIALPIYAARQMGMPVLAYLKQAYTWPIASALPGAAAAWLLAKLIAPTSWPVWIAEFLISLAISAFLAWSTCIDESMRQRVKQKMGWR